ncbi:Stigma-specific STIG1-like protein 3 [Cardamine amara subsp. amara]|uniref:Stigma-specific STIG1-like protein 3 n=1 Tax=Cardamine amara subsp. amara TaxID=228776 RepID=A0ABD1A7I1_CARAN
MNTFKISHFVVVFIMVLAIAITLIEPLRVEAKCDQVHKYDRGIPATTLRKDWSRISAMTCNKSAKVCRLKGSSGRNCCRKKCVDLRTDRLNCGRCGNRCKYSEVCCKGYCVNPMFDKRHCGGCFKKCNKGRSCAYGMCNYA